MTGLPTVTQTINPAEDNDTPQRVQYAADRKLGSHVTSIRLDNYPASSAVTINMAGEGKDVILHKQLSEAGFNVKHQRLIRVDEPSLLVENSDKQQSLVPLAIALGGIPESSGGIDPNTAMQIIDKELSRTGKTAQQAGFVSFSRIMPTGTMTHVDTQQPIKPQAPLSYLTVDIKHPFSAATYLGENGSENGEKTTRIGARDAKAMFAIAEQLQSKGGEVIRLSTPEDDTVKSGISEALKRAGMNVRKPLAIEGEKDIVVRLPAAQTAKLLAEKGLIPDSIAREIASQKDAAKTTFSAREKQRPHCSGRGTS